MAIYPNTIMRGVRGRFDWIYIWAESNSAQAGRGHFFESAFYRGGSPGFLFVVIFCSGEQQSKASWQDCRFDACRLRYYRTNLIMPDACLR